MKRYKVRKYSPLWFAQYIIAVVAVILVAGCAVPMGW